jgi:hypothetical protein
MTPGNSYYLSDTAGGYKDSSGTVVQIVGMAIDATHLLVRLTQNRSMTAGDIDTDAVGSAEIAAGAVDSAEILAGAVDEAHLAVGGASAGLSGLVCKFVADANVIGGIPVIHRIAIGDATANTDVVLTHKTHICKIWYVKSTTAGGSSDKVRAISGTSTNYITEDLAVGGTANAPVTPATLISTYCEIAAGGTLRFSATKASNVACVAYVLGFRVA